MASDAVRVLRRQVEPYRQIPLDDDYWARLVDRAEKNDRVAIREASWILKSVLDGRYQIVKPAVAQG
jgi:hypothetical protein